MPRCCGGRPLRGRAAGEECLRRYHARHAPFRADWFRNLRGTTAFGRRQVLRPHAEGKFSFGAILEDFGHFHRDAVDLDAAIAAPQRGTEA